MSRTIPHRRRAWWWFALGLLAPFALPLLVFLILGSNSQSWMHGTAWMVLLVGGLVAGLQHRRWAFLAGVVTAITVSIAIGALRDLGWLA